MVAGCWDHIDNCTKGCSLESFRGVCHASRIFGGKSRNDNCKYYYMYLTCTTRPSEGVIELIETGLEST